MAQPNCIKCGNTRFEMKESRSMSGTDLKWFLVQCANCGGVVGVVDFFHHGALLDRIEHIERLLTKRYR